MALQKVHIKKLTKEEIELDDNFYSKESSCSCDIDQIKGFIFGPQHSRFWALRKNFQCMTL